MSNVAVSLLVYAPGELDTCGLCWVCWFQLVLHQGGGEELVKSVSGHHGMGACIHPAGDEGCVKRIFS